MKKLFAILLALLMLLTLAACGKEQPNNSDDNKETHAVETPINTRTVRKRMRTTMKPMTMNWTLPKSRTMFRAATPQMTHRAMMTHQMIRRAMIRRKTESVRNLRMRWTAMRPSSMSISSL